MKIRGIGVSFPEKVVSTSDTIDMIESRSKDVFEGDLSAALTYIGDKLVKSGAATRRWLKRGEKPIWHIDVALREALDKAGMEKDDIDLLIYTGVGKGFLEPGQSYLVAHALGFKHIQCFDVLDACMSWSRAMFLAYSFFKTGDYRRIVIVNGEFVNVEGDALFPDNYCLRNFDQISWTLPNYTVGNAATATILEDSPDEWEWHFTSRPDLADLCTIPAIGFKLYSDGSDKIGRNGPYHFTSFGRELHEFGTDEIVKVFKMLSVPEDQIARIFIHASSRHAWDKFGEIVGIQPKLFHIYSEYGNLVSASVPAGMYLAEKEGAIQRGNQLVGWVGSAGMSFSSYAFVY